jgi:nitrate/nitrite-specific signal transduction histidine kinase
MEARAVELGGSLRIDRRRGGGTRLVASLPIDGSAASSVVPADGTTEGAGP